MKYGRRLFLSFMCLAVLASAAEKTVCVNKHDKKDAAVIGMAGNDIIVRYPDGCTKRMTWKENKQAGTPSRKRAAKIWED